ncbi:hypothetical protein FACS1894152_1790 [Bacilli bacterium]|nr:hypothetical protein FACS1894152_1790 [Bacilli bacterium]
MDRLGLVAGSGRLPLDLADYCKNNGIKLFCVLIKPFANGADYSDTTFMETSIGCLGRAMKFFKQNDVSNLVFAGGVKKPSLGFGLLKMDFSGFLLAKNILKNKLLGDNTVLETVIGFLEKRGFKVLEIDSILKDLKFEKGFNNKITCSGEYLEDMEIGCNVLKKLSEFDIGQSVVVQQKNITGIECSEGTAGLIERTGQLKSKVGNRPVLVKIKKTNQTKKIDLPSIGPDTMEQLHNSGFAGIALDYKNCLVISREKTLEKATKYDLFVYGLDI